MKDGSLARPSLDRGPSSGPAVSRHLRVLERAGLITRGRDAQWRPARLDAGPLRDVAGWAEQFRRFWEPSFARLDSYLEHLNEKERPDGHDESD